MDVFLLRRSIRKILGIIGGFVWSITIFVRENHYNFFLGILPNICAIWVIAMIIENITIQNNKKYNPYLTMALLFICALASEIIHALFLNSPFDIFDIIVSIIAIIIYLLVEKK